MATCFATACADGTASDWRRDGTHAACLRGHADAVESVAFAPDGELVVTAASGGQPAGARRAP
jgi:WD40 repeat protein